MQTYIGLHKFDSTKSKFKARFKGRADLYMGGVEISSYKFLKNVQKWHSKTQNNKCKSTHTQFIILYYTG